MVVIKFKTVNEKKEFESNKVKSYLKFIVMDIASFFNANGHDFVVTDVLSEALEDKRLRRVSRSHQEGRAVDVRTRGIPEEFLKTVEEKFEKIYKNEAAISMKTKKPDLIVRHNSGNGDHFHIQVREVRDV